MCVWASHPCSRPHLQVEGRRWGHVSEAAQTSRAPLSAPRKTGWTGTCSQQGVLSAGGQKKWQLCDFFFFFGCLFSDWAHTLSLTIQMCPAAFRPSFRGAYSGWWRWHSRLGKRWPARFLTGEGRPSCPHRRPPVENTGLDTATGVYKAMTRVGGERNRYNVRYEPFQICIIKLA